MKKTLLLLTLAFTGCQPQTESREHMDLASNRMSDSILKLLDTGFTEPGKILAGTGLPISSFSDSLTPKEAPK